MLTRIPRAFTLVFSLLVLSLLSLAHSHAIPGPLARRDAYTTLRAATKGGNGPQLVSVLPAPQGAQAQSIPIGSASTNVFAWVSSNQQETSATNVYIILHGIDRNAATYFKVLNDAYQAAAKANLPNAAPATFLVAPLFFATNQDFRAYNASSLAWGDPNAWTGGDGSTHPAGSNVSVFTVLDALLDRYSAYPSVKTVTFVAHGGGAQVLQRYAVLGKDPSDSIDVRYVVGDPSSMLYFTQDRPVPLNPSTCPIFDTFRYGFSNYNEPYALQPSAPADLFKRYIARDVRYVVGLDDVLGDEGDQLCAGRAMGGSERKDRSLNYFAYLNLLTNSTSVPSYPGLYPALDPGKAGRNGGRGYMMSTSAQRAAFAGAGQLMHQIYHIPAAGHNADQVYGSGDGQQAIFGAAASAASSTASGTASSSATSSSLPSLTSTSEGKGPTTTRASSTRETSLGGGSNSGSFVGPSLITMLLAVLALLFLI